jgi:hypothetical protein
MFLEVTNLDDMTAFDDMIPVIEVLAAPVSQSRTIGADWCCVMDLFWQGGNTELPFTDPPSNFFGRQLPRNLAAIKVKEGRRGRSIGDISSGRVNKT